MTTSFADIKLKRVTDRSKYWLSIATSDEISDGLAWYDEAMAYATYISDIFDITRVMAAAIISALSPNNKWERNNIDVFNLCQA